MSDIQAISEGLKLGDDGIWYSSESEVVSYPQDGNKDCLNIEDNSFWFKHRNNCIVSIVKAFQPESNGTIFDIGGGNGFVSLGLTEAGFDMVLVEPGRFGASNAKSRGLNDVICATTDKAKFNKGTLPAVGLFDVIEHIEDDIDFLKLIRDQMKKNGRLYATVPSYKFLWSAEDDYAGHFKRYTLNNLSSALISAGFEVQFSSYIFRFLPLPIFLFRTLPYKLGLSKAERKPESACRDHVAQGGIGAGILSLLLRSEINNLSNKKAMKLGGSCIIVATNP
ncbi:MAG: class I SAM-dependent methyltransferase [Desulfuromonadales bacterium]|nr:class I SAM-dependent methyltransferase [Desulfuromonadales bacterium]